MRALFIAFCLTLSFLCAVSQDTAQAQTASVRLTAFDKKDAPVETLRREDIRLFEDGVAQNIETFQLQSERPLSLSLLIDTSASQEPILPAIKAAALAFVNTALRPNKDQMAVLTFTNEAHLEQTLTNDVTVLRGAIERVRFDPPAGYIGGGIVTRMPGRFPMQGSTAIWDALWLTSEKVLAQAPADALRAVVVVTDGVDTSSRMQSSKAVERALRAGVKIYCVGIADTDSALGIDVAKGDLRKISGRTGGRAFFPRQLQNLRDAFAQVRQDLDSSYLVSYVPAGSKSRNPYRKLRIELLNPELRRQNISLAYPQGYFVESTPQVATP